MTDRIIRRTHRDWTLAWVADLIPGTATRPSDAVPCAVEPVTTLDELDDSQLRSLGVEHAHEVAACDSHADWLRAKVTAAEEKASHLQAENERLAKELAEAKDGDLDDENAKLKHCLKQALSDWFEEDWNWGDEAQALLEQEPRMKYGDLRQSHDEKVKRIDALESQLAEAERAKADSERRLSAVSAAAEETGWNGVDNAKHLTQYILDIGRELNAEHDEKRALSARLAKCEAVVSKMLATVRAGRHPDVAYAVERWAAELSAALSVDALPPPPATTDAAPEGVEETRIYEAAYNACVIPEHSIKRMAGMAALLRHRKDSPPVVDSPAGAEVGPSSMRPWTAEAVPDGSTKVLDRRGYVVCFVPYPSDAAFIVTLANADPSAAIEAAKREVAAAIRETLPECYSCKRTARMVARKGGEPLCEAHLSLLPDHAIQPAPWLAALDLCTRILSPGGVEG